MPTDAPVACSLTPVELPVRLAEMADIGKSALLGVDVAGTRAVLRFRPGADTRRRLDAIVVAESRCCAFLGMAVNDESDALVLTITAPPDAEAILGDLAAAFSTAKRARWNGRC